ncbi:deoxyribodipyrimidine photo-lyase [Roseibium sp. TrichSKD4]|uniref:cryptochrome/photolyase family protein n=1 Tax=Roseibium sp. TrichSKD4 TaxID=744980 RepID=UPI0005901DE9|nr:deoxyribodipyrimidine photo-lyase [Roseibium sp. TrichSKD4]
MTSIVWFRQDLRVADNAALYHAAQEGPVIPVFIWDDAAPLTNSQAIGAAGKWWLHHSLTALREQLGDLVVLRGDPATVLQELALETKAEAVRWNRAYDEYGIERDKKIKTELRESGLMVKSFKGNVLHEPWDIKTGSGSSYKVYSHYWRAVKARGVAAPLPVPDKIELAVGWVSLGIEALDLLPRDPNWAEGWENVWTPGEQGARERLCVFLDQGLNGYGELRNRPDLPNVSRLSPHLRFGEISPTQIWATTQMHADVHPEHATDADKFLSEIVWREFSYHLLFHFPDLPEKNWKVGFDAYPWRENAEDLRAWQRGQTGYPIVDAGMRELWQTGYMHNRVRMIVASFLVKHLRISWQHGENWFRDTLLDADVANNSASWQWVSGTGADAAPYFRIFNPYTQAQKFDPDGAYIRKWVPELKDLRAPQLFAPQDASPMDLRAAGVRLGETYPLPMVDHQTARKKALDGYEAVKAENAENAA